MFVKMRAYMFVGKGLFVGFWECWRTALACMPVSAASAHPNA